MKIDRFGEKGDLIVVRHDNYILYDGKGMTREEYVDFLGEIFQKFVIYKGQLLEQWREGIVGITMKSGTYQEL